MTAFDEVDLGEVCYLFIGHIGSITVVSSLNYIQQNRIKKWNTLFCVVGMGPGDTICNVTPRLQIQVHIIMA